MYYPMIYTGHTDLRDAIRNDFEAEGYAFLRPESSEAEAAIDSGEYAAITYRGGDTAIIEDFPSVTPRIINLPVASDGSLDGALAARVIRAHLEGWGHHGIAEIEEEIDQFRRQAGTA
jgi:hypothetical protein